MLQFSLLAAHSDLRIESLLLLEALRRPIQVRVAPSANQPVSPACIGGLPFSRARHMFFLSLICRACPRTLKLIVESFQHCEKFINRNRGNIYSAIVSPIIYEQFSIRQYVAARKDNIMNLPLLGF
jgi:hypothetical protein